MRNSSLVRVLATWSLLAAFVWIGVGSVVWSVQIEGRALHCNDGPTVIAGFLTPVADHKRAGDVLADGWTWEGVEVIRRRYLASITLLWMVSYLYLARRLLLLPRPPSTNSPGNVAERRA